MPTMVNSSAAVVCLCERARASWGEVHWLLRPAEGHMQVTCLLPSVDQVLLLKKNVGACILLAFIAEVTNFVFKMRCW